LLPFAGGGAIGMIAGRLFAGRIAGPALQRGFAVVIVLVGLGMLIESFV
jgi:uncharacterized membrane protein YfcA